MHDGSCSKFCDTTSGSRWLPEKTHHSTTMRRVNVNNPFLLKDVTCNVRPHARCEAGFRFVTNAKRTCDVHIYAYSMDAHVNRRRASAEYGTQVLETTHRIMNSRVLLVFVADVVAFPHHASDTIPIIVAEAIIRPRCECHFIHSCTHLCFMDKFNIQQKTPVRIEAHMFPVVSLLAAESEHEVHTCFAVGPLYVNVSEHNAGARYCAKHIDTPLRGEGVHTHTEHSCSRAANNCIKPL